MATEGKGGRPPSFLEQVRKYYPGREVPVSPDGELKVRVFAAGIEHVEFFARACAAAIASVLRMLPADAIETPGVGAPPGAMARVTIDDLARALPAFVAAISVDLAAVVEKCCVPAPRGLPHWVGADIVAAWIEENFDREDKVRPWVRAMEGVLRMATGEKVDLWTPLSSALSPAAIQRMKSSIARGAAGLIGGGPSGSSESAGSPPTGQTQESGPPSSTTSHSQSGQGSTGES